ncbi:hypothetical protein D3C85_1719450 [compost metagenome]
MDQVGKQHAQHHCRHEGDQQIGREALGLTFLGQTQDHVEDLASKFPDHRQDGP